MSALTIIKCPATYTPSSSGSPVFCLRQESGHIGDHHGYFTVARPGHEPWEQLWAWAEDGSAHGFNADGSATATPCSRCGTPHDRSPAMRSKGADLDVCFGCTLWDRRAAEYAAGPGTLLRPHDDLGPFQGQPNFYSWATRNPMRPSAGTGSFGGREYTVTLDDGRAFGPDSRLWSGGRIPWWRFDEFPTNCTIEEKKRAPSFRGPLLTGIAS